MTPAITLSVLIVFTVSLNLVAAVREWARHRLLDVPNERSSHAEPTPRGGGLAIVLAFLGATLWLWQSGGVTGGLAAALVLGGGLVAATGFLDDRRSLPATPRLAAQIAAAALGLALIGGVETLPVGSWQWTPGAAGWAIALVGLVWLVNLTNFMDGIDGLVGSHTVFVAGAGAGLCWLCGAPAEAVLLLMLMAATLGFLVFNWPPASIFMGDVASGFLGLVLGFIAIETAPEINLWAWGILLAPFMADATVTRAVRIARYGDWLGAHRAHVYQRLARAWSGHRHVVHAYWLVALTAVLPAALAAALMPALGWLLMLCVWVVFFAAAFLLGGGRDDADARAPA